MDHRLSESKFEQNMKTRNQILAIEDEKERNKEIAYWALLDGFDEIRFIPPPNKPKELVEYDNLTFEKKQKIGPEFWRQPSILKYKESLGFVESENRSNIEWLRKLLTFLPENDHNNILKVKGRLNEFQENEAKFKRPF